MPLMIRLPASDYLYFDESLEQWHINEAAELAKILASKGVDWIDVAGGGNDRRQQVKPVPGYQVPWAAEVKKAVAGTATIVSATGNIASGKQAQGYIEEGTLDAVTIGRPFLRDPNLVWNWADALEVPIYVASQCKCD